MHSGKMYIRHLFRYGQLTCASVLLILSTSACETQKHACLEVTSRKDYENKERSIPVIFSSLYYYLNIRCCCLLVTKSKQLILAFFARSYFGVFEPCYTHYHITLKYANEDYPVFTHVIDSQLIKIIHLYEIYNTLEKSHPSKCSRKYHHILAHK